MKPCPWCRREIPNWASICTHSDCGRPLDPQAVADSPASPPSSMPPSPSVATGPPPALPQTPQVPIDSQPPGPADSAAPPPPADQAAAPAGPSSAQAQRLAPPPPPPQGPPAAGAPPPGFETLAGEPIDLDLKLQLEGLQRRVRARRRQGLVLGNGAVAALVIALVFGAGYHLRSVFRYAALEPGETKLVRDQSDPDRLVLVYQPASRGRVGFLRGDTEPRTELLDHVTADQVGTAQRFLWRAGAMRPGDALRVTHRRGLSLRHVDLEVPPAEEMPPLGDGRIEGLVRDAADGEPVVGAEVRVVGTRLTTKTDARGRFEIRGAPTGPVPLEIAAPDFSTEQLERSLEPGGRCVVKVLLSRGMKAGRIRIELTWSDPSLDLDAHLRGPLPDGEQFHVYYHQMGDLRSREFVRLDADEASRGGPETITVLGVLPGTYHYFVHDYTHRDKPQDTALSRSGAEVVVRQAGQAHRFRAGHDRPGNTWNVCRIEVTRAGAEVQRVDSFEGTRVEALGLYAKRTREDRSRWIGHYGGSLRSEDAVAAGLAWLARHQAADGSWGDYSLGDGPRARCEKDAAPCTGPGDNFEMAQTGLALLAFQAGGHYHFNGRKYSELVRRGLDWMVEHQRPDGALVSDRPKEMHSLYHRYYMYDHGIAAFALAEACAVANDARRGVDARYVRAATRAVRFIEGQQHADGGWRYSDDPGLPGDSSVSGWQVLALKSAREAAILPIESCVAKTSSFFRHLEMDDRGRTWYLRPPRPRPPEFQTEATTAIGMLVRQFMFDEPDSEFVREAAGYLADYAEQSWRGRDLGPREKDFYLWYNGTLAMYQAGGRNWARWNAVVRDLVLRLQRIDGCTRGSWDPTSLWGEKGGRIYSTALAVLTLEVYYRYAGHEETLDWFEVTSTGDAKAAP